MEQIVRNSVSTQRITFIVLAAFSALALLLAAIGIYGVVSYSVAQRTQEIGIRMALGAQPRDVLRMVIAQGARLAALGLVIGILAALALTRLMTSLLYSVSSSDPATFATVTVLLALTAMFASYIPARRILRFDPMRTLRCD
jgi:putative ABC transport system permease protein